MIIPLVDLMITKWAGKLTYNIWQKQNKYKSDIDHNFQSSYLHQLQALKSLLKKQEIRRIFSVIAIYCVCVCV